MTSPTQLQYLDAIGIPVWVSRDLVSFEKSGKLDSVDLLQKNVSLEKENVTNSNIVINSDNIDNTHNNSALSILNSLDDTNPTKRNTAPNNAVAFDNQVDEVLENTKVPEVNIPDDNVAIQSNIPNNSNLLQQTTQHYIFANGNEAADWLIIGHSPEPFTGIGNEPFAGESGDLLNNMLLAVDMAIPQQQAYFVNVLDVNQSAQPSVGATEELSTKLYEIMNSVKPKIVLLVGQIAAQTILKSEDPLIIMRSKVHKIVDSTIPCVVTYYPSYLLHKQIDKRKAWDDLKLAKSLVRDAS